MRFDSIRFRIRILYSLVLGIILVIYSGILYFSLSYTLHEDLDSQLALKAHKIVAVMQNYLKTSENNHNSLLNLIKNSIEKNDADPCFDNMKTLRFQEIANLTLKRDFISISSPSGKILGGSYNTANNVIPILLKQKGISIFNNTTFSTVKLPENLLRIISVPFPSNGKKEYFIHVGTSLKPITKLLHREKILIIVDIVIVLLVTSFIGQFFVSRILKPVKEMAITADKITRKSLSARVESTHLDYEMQHLVDSINSMINRLEKAFKHIANFSLDVSHELKTPLAIMRSESEFALIKERSHKEYQSVLQSNLDQIQRMKKLVDDLLLLAKVDHEIEVFTFEKLELCGFLKKLYEKEKMLAAEKKINIEFETSIDTVFVSADTLHLRRLFINLLANAIKFTPLGGKIGITVKQTAEIAYIAISDTGIGINQEELDRIFERFYRTEEADETAEPGSGLGLCLALSIVKVHNGKIDVESTVGKGSTFTIALPTMVL